MHCRVFLTSKSLSLSVVITYHSCFIYVLMYCIAGGFCVQSQMDCIILDIEAVFELEALKISIHHIFYKTLIFSKTCPIMYGERGLFVECESTFNSASLCSFQPLLARCFGFLAHTINCNLTHKYASLDAFNSVDTGDGCLFPTDSQRCVF